MMYVIRRDDGTYWLGGDRWSTDRRAARGFQYESDAWLTGYRECPTPVQEWRAVPLSEAA